MDDSWKLVVVKDSNLECNTFLANPIWLKMFIKAGGEAILYKEWFNKGILFINDLVKEDGSYLSLEQLHQIFGIRTDLMKYNSIISAVKQGAKSFKNGNYKLKCPFVPSYAKNILKHKRGSRDMYDILNINVNEPSGKYKWSKILEIPNLNWNYIYELLFTVRIPNFKGNSTKKPQNISYQSISYKN